MLPLWEKRLKVQLDDVARSQKRNIEEGWKRPTTSEYLRFLGYAQASLEEVRGDIRDAKTDEFLRSQPGSTLNPRTLTYEMLLELTNKTDFLLRKLVESLEAKFNTDKRDYLIEKARISDPFKRK